MRYKIEIAPSALKPVKRQSQEFRKTLYQETQKLAKTPFKHERLGPPLSMCHSYHFGYKGTAFRIAYAVNQKEKRLIVVLVGPREGFYDTLRRKLR